MLGQQFNSFVKTSKFLYEFNVCVALNSALGEEQAPTTSFGAPSPFVAQLGSTFGQLVLALGAASLFV